MQTRTNLGLSLGHALAGAFDPTARQLGELNGMRAQELKSQIDLQSAQRDKTLAEADQQRRLTELGGDDSLAKTALLALGITGDDANKDYSDYLKTGSYTPKSVPLAFTNGGDNLPAPAYVDKFPDVAKTLASLRTALATGDKSLDLPKTLQGIQRNDISAGLTPQNAPQISLALSALDGKDPTNITDASLVQNIANGGDYGTLAKALLASKGKGVYDSFNGGTTNVLDGTQSINDIGSSIIGENNARAVQANAGAKENLAQASLAGIRGDSIKAGKGDGSQAREKDFARIRDDIRADYNAQYPYNSIDGNRGKGAPDFNTFTKQWLSQYNIDQNEFFRNTNQGGSALSRPVEKKSSPEYQEYVAAFKAEKDPERRKRMTEFARAKGIVK